MRETNSELHRQRVGESLRGKFGPESRRWKGNSAGYVAKHLWLTKHFDKGNECDRCGSTENSRLEWSNISGEHNRNRYDYNVLCPSCHRKKDLAKLKTNCPQGHEYTIKNTYINSRGHRECKICRNKSQERYRNANTNNKV